MGCARQAYQRFSRRNRTLATERLQQHVRLTAPASLTAALAEAERTEVILGDTLKPPPHRRVAALEVEEEEALKQTTATSTEGSVPELLLLQWPRECYCCGRPGHIARHCPEAVSHRDKQQPAGNAQWTVPGGTHPPPSPSKERRPTSGLAGRHRGSPCDLPS